MNEILTTEELVNQLNNQTHTVSPDKNDIHSRKKMTHKSVGRIIYWFLLGVMVGYTLFSVIPMTFENRAVNLLGKSTLLAVPNDQELSNELFTDVIHIRKFSFDEVQVGDRIVIYGKYASSLYWVEEVVAIDEVNQKLDTTFGYFIRNTYDKSDVVATYVKRADLLSTIFYVSTTPRGFASLLMIEVLVFGISYYYFIRKPKEKK